MSSNEASKQSVLEDLSPDKAIVKLAVPATLALLAKAVYNLVDTAYIGMLGDDLAMAGVGVTVPLLLIKVSIENIFAAGAAVLAGRQLGAKDQEGASRTVTTIIGISALIGAALCVGGILFLEPLMRAFGATDASLPYAMDYAFWMFIALFNQNLVIVDFGRRLLISQVILYPAFGLCDMMTITFQTIGESRFGLFLSLLRQGLFYVPCILILPGLLGIYGICLSQPVADVLTMLICLCSIKPLKSTAAPKMGAVFEEDEEDEKREKETRRRPAWKHRKQN